MKTPLYYAAIPFALGIIAQRELSIVIVVIVCLFVALNWSRKFPAIAFAGLGFVMAFINQPRNMIPYNEPIEVVCRVENTPTITTNGKWQRTTSHVISYKESTGAWHGVDQKVQTYIDTATVISLGNTLHFSTKQLIIDSVYGRYYMNQGITGRLFAREPKILKTDTTILERIKVFSAKLSDKIANIETSPRNIALMQSLALGDKSGISREQRNDNVRAGTAHILAVSGLHVGIIVMILAPLLGWIKLFRRGLIFYGVALIIILWGYAAITGFSPSVGRAVLMFTMYQIGVMISRSSNNMNTLLAAGLLLLIWNPNYIFDIGFQLSFAAMFGIVLFYRPIYSLWQNKAWSLVAITLAAQIAVEPLACYYFGNIPLFGIVTNLALWAIVPTIIALTFAYIIFGFEPFGSAAAFVAEQYNNFVEWSSSHQWIAIEGVDMPLWLNLVIYGVMIVAVRIWLMPKQEYPNH